MKILDVFTIASYLALTLDIVLQIFHVRKTKSSRDISTQGLFIRLSAILVVYYKFVSLGETPLIIGQSFIVIAFITYIVTVVLHSDRFKK